MVASRYFFAGFRYGVPQAATELCRGRDGQETFLLCRSAARVDKERAMHARFAQRIEERLHALARRIERSKQPLDRGVIERRIGRFLERNSRAGAGFSIAITDERLRPPRTVVDRF
jgi:hypothetical protein